MLSVSELPLLVEQRVSGGEFSDVLCLDSGMNLDLASDDMTDLWRQGIAVNDDNYPVPENITDEVPQP